MDTGPPISRVESVEKLSSSLSPCVLLSFSSAGRSKCRMWWSLLTGRFRFQNYSIKVAKYKPNGFIWIRNIYVIKNEIEHISFFFRQNFWTICDYLNPLNLPATGMGLHSVTPNNESTVEKWKLNKRRLLALCVSRKECTQTARAVRYRHKSCLQVNFRFTTVLQRYSTQLLMKCMTTFALFANFVYRKALKAHLLDKHEKLVGPISIVYLFIVEEVIQRLPMPSLERFSLTVSFLLFLFVSCVCQFIPSNST